MTNDMHIKPAAPETDIVEPFHDERLFHEINLLRLEGYYFCLDPKEAARRRGKRELQETLKLGTDAMEKRPVVISINPDYGQPSTTAYKILQAIIKKLSDFGACCTHGLLQPARTGAYDGLHLVWRQRPEAIPARLHAAARHTDSVLAL